MKKLTQRTFIAVLYSLVFLVTLNAQSPQFAKLKSNEQKEEIQAWCDKPQLIPLGGLAGCYYSDYEIHVRRNGSTTWQDGYIEVSVTGAVIREIKRIRTLFPNEITRYDNVSTVRYYVPDFTIFEFVAKIRIIATDRFFFHARAVNVDSDVCTSPWSSLEFPVINPNGPGNITGSSFATDCNPNTIYNYSVDNLAYYSYNWEVPAGWSIVGGQGTSNVSVKSNAANAGGILKVTANNTCGASIVRTANLTINPTTLQMPAAPLLKSGEALGCTNGENNFVISPDISSRSSFLNYRWSTTDRVGGAYANLASFPQSNTNQITYDTRQTEVRVKYNLLNTNQSNLYVCAEALYGCGISARNCSPLVTPRSVLPITDISRISTVPYDNLSGVHNFKITSPYPAGAAGVSYIYSIKGILTGGVQPVITANNGTTLETTADNINVRVNNANGVQVTVSTKNQCGISTTSFIKDFPFNNSLEFDGIDDYAQISHSNVMNIGRGGFTFEAWINTTAVSNVNNTNATILSKMIPNPSQSNSNGVVWGLNSNGKIFIDRTGLRTTSTHTANLRDGNCHHIATTFDPVARKVYFYVDGVLRDSPNANAIDINNNEVVRIGNWLFQQNAQTYPFKSIIDEVRMWKVTRSAQDIQDYWRTSLMGNESGLIGYWKMNDGFGQVVKDFGVNGLNAFLGSNATNADANDPLWKTQYAVCSNIARQGIFDENTELLNNTLGALVVYPNPASNTMNISLAYPNDVLEKSRIIDMQGKEVRQYGNRQISLDISGIERGIYMLEATINGVLERKKIEIIK